MQGFGAAESTPSTEPNSLVSIDQADSVRSKDKLHHPHQQPQPQSPSQQPNHNHTASTNGNAINNLNNNINNLSNNNNNNSDNGGGRGSTAVGTSAALATGAGTGYSATKYNSTLNSAYKNQASSHSMPPAVPTNVFDSTLRKSPEGKDNDALLSEGEKTVTGGNVPPIINHNNNSTNALVAGHKKFGNDISTEIFSTSNDNGKINVQVTVLVGKPSFHIDSIVTVYSMQSW